MLRVVCCRAPGGWEAADGAAAAEDLDDARQPSCRRHRSTGDELFCVIDELMGAEAEQDVLILSLSELSAPQLIRSLNHSMRAVRDLSARPTRQLAPPSISPYV